ncbi:MAG TPA: peptidoglycan editing factor PgeF [Hyphomonadaceae bacterium]|nr:peptidoglycan editing factor PgeF [Hyphomonadaceae bacterium]
MKPLQSQALLSDEVAHGFFGRQGGVSGGIYASLNCGYGSGDDSGSVCENRTRVATWLGTREEKLITLYQIHSADALHVTAPWTRAAPPKADAMATTLRGVALGVLAADCAPILLSDAKAGVIGCAHSGWKGAIGGVVESVVALMERLGASRARIRAAVGPCISQASYEVGPEFEARFVDTEAANKAYFVRSPRMGHWQFDLPGYVTARLKATGIGAVEALKVCTYEHNEAYFSFRRTTHRGETDYGRNVSAIMLKP